MMLVKALEQMKIQGVMFVQICRVYISNLSLEFPSSLLVTLFLLQLVTAVLYEDEKIAGLQAQCK